TKFGDAGADFMPIGDLYKTQVREMAAHLGRPNEIVDKTPTAGLWPGQTDEGEIGITYDELDRVLLGIELQMEPEAIAEKAAVPLDRVRYVETLVASSVHKRKMPLIPKLGVRTVGLDWRALGPALVSGREDTRAIGPVEDDLGRGSPEWLAELRR